MRALTLALTLVGAALLSPAQPAPAQEPGPGSTFSAYAAGSALHAEVLRTAVGGPTLVGAGIANSAASVDSDGLEAAVADELGQVVQPAAPAGKRSYGRGAGVEVSLGAGTPLSAGLTLAGVAEAAAPPSAALHSDELGPVRLHPLAHASLARGQARPAWSDRTCVIGQPMAFGLGYAADVELLDVGGPRGDGTFTRPVVATNAGSPTGRSVTQSRSFTYIQPVAGGSFALVSETRQTIAPVTLFRGTPVEATIELLGEWFLRVTATGKPGGATVEYGPAVDGGPDTPAVRLVVAGTVTELSVQQVLGAGGLRLSAGPLLDLAVGEPPRVVAAPGRDPATGSDPEASPDGTRAEAAVDVVRVRLLQPVPSGGPRAVELRLGHMEAAAAVPTGGIGCRIPIRKQGAPSLVNPGDGFTWRISIPAAADAVDGLSCDLVGVRAVDTATATPGVVYRLLSASHGGVIAGDTVTWDDLGRYRPGQPPIVVTITGRAEPESARGVVSDTVKVTAALDNCTAGVPVPPLGDGTKPAALRGSFTLEGPTVLGWRGRGR